MSLQEIQNSLDKINRSSGIEQLVRQASPLIDTQLASVTTKVGTDLTKPVNGIQPLTQSLDDVSPSVASSQLSQLTGVLAVGQLTQKVPEFQRDLVKQVGGSRNDLNQITGSTNTTGDGFLDVVITAPYPEAIAQAVNAAVPKAQPAKLKTAVTGVQDFGVGQLANVSNPDAVTSSLVGGVSGTAQSLNNLKNRFAQLFSQNVSTALSSLGALGSNLSQNLKVADESGITIRANQLDEGAKNWQGSNTPKGYGFTMIGTHEELEVELKSAAREITGLIVHWSESFYNQDIGSDEIHDYNRRVDGGIPYHYVIRRDGTIQRGRPIDTAGGTLPNNHGIYSIQLVLVGGINAPVGTPDPKRFLSKNSFTRQQMNTFDVFLEKAFLAWPGLQVMGHSDVDRQQKDPGFDVPDYVYNKFGKTLIYNDPSSETALSRSMLSTKRVTR